MRVVVFAGPTLPAEVIRGELDADVRPPARRGDLLRAALAHPAAIGLIDGYFARVPAVWHKEILWAMSQGIHVFGAASMGALRAAELSSFGMEGVGAIFEGYRSGTLEDDDEVAIAHADADLGYRAFSEAMVNVRATLSKMRESGRLSESRRVELEAAMKALPYSDRSWPRLLEQVEDAEERASLRAWLADGRVDQKRADAVAMIRSMAERARAGWSPKHVDFRFAPTDVWEALVTLVRSEESATLTDAKETDLVDEVITSGRGEAAFAGAAARGLCLELARRTKLEIDPRAVEAVVEEFRRERGLLSAESFTLWLGEQRLDEASLTAFFSREAIVRRVRAILDRELLTHVADHLRQRGVYGEVLDRACDKRRALEARGLDQSTLADTATPDLDLWGWYVRERLQGAPRTSLEAFASANHSNVERVTQALLREYLYVTTPQLRDGDD